MSKSSADTKPVRLGGVEIVKALVSITETDLILARLITPESGSAAEIKGDSLIVTDLLRAAHVHAEVAADSWGDSKAHFVASRVNGFSS